MPLETQEAARQRSRQLAGDRAPASQFFLGSKQKDTRFVLPDPGTPESVVRGPALAGCPERFGPITDAWAVQHFGLIFLLWAFAFGYFFLHRFLWVSCWKKRRPNPVSACLGFAMLGWPMVILRDMHWVSLRAVTVFYSAALVFGFLIVLFICLNEASRRHPFSAEDDW